MFENASFIKAGIPHVKEYDPDRSPCVMFRRSFRVDTVQNARLSVCGLGIAHYWLNGKRVTEDLFIAPVSDYRKTLWYTCYDVSKLLHSGENTLAVICGNGFYNESFRTSWNHNLVSWRDNPKFILELTVDGLPALVSDASWRCTADTPVLFNHLRSGEYFDSRLYDPDWNKTGFDDSAWKHAVIDDTPPAGVFRECFCPPIRECAVYQPVSIVRTGDKRFLFDIGQNISGYVRLRVCQKSGDALVIRYAEQINADNTLKLNRMGDHYPESAFMTDRFICNGGEVEWHPLFVYHGFRYVEVEGLENAAFDTVTGVFVHQAVREISSFASSNPTLDRLFYIGKMATLSNLFYMPTDCPTREKLGWANDAQASCEQMLTNFDTAEFFRKWLVDICDAMREDGCLPGIIPTSDWGFDWGNGPVSEAVLFEVPYRIYLYTGDKQPLLYALPYFRRHLEYLNTRLDGDGMINYGLDDWTCPNPTKTPVQLINTALLTKCLRVAAMAASFAGDPELVREYTDRLTLATALYKKHFLAPDGTCVIDDQTPVAMTIFHGLYDDLTPLRAQLKRLVEEVDFHHNCGMVGLRYLYVALNACGLQGYAYKIVTARGYPSYTDFLNNGATTLWEDWRGEYSKNHHMFSDYMSWMMKTLVGINVTPASPERGELYIDPAFPTGLDWCAGHMETAYGRIDIRWERQNDTVKLDITVGEGARALYKGKYLPEGLSSFMI